MVKVESNSKSKSGFFLLNIFIVLLVACGMERTHTVSGAASATATAATVSAERASCKVGSDQSHCLDPSPRREDSLARPLDSEQLSELKDQGSCAIASSGQCESPPASGAVPVETKFRTGDIIELYNPESKDIQVVFPSIVKAKHSGPTYHVTKTTDGKEVKNIPEKFLHMYVPYKKGSEVLCNIGEFKPLRPIIVRCTVLAYEPAADRGAMVLQGTYSVKVHATKVNEEYTTTLPVWKLQRRYLASD